MAIQPLSWQELESLTDYSLDYINGNTNAQSRLRLFHQPESTVRVTLYRDYHAWCPYCQKVWLWLEEKQIPYRIEKVTMFCYGQKESWYKQRVPSGMLPAVEIDGQLTEKDCPPPAKSEIALRYLRDRISIPRDMSIYAGKRRSTALEYTAQLIGDRQPEPIPIRHRQDQNPKLFGASN